MCVERPSGFDDAEYHAWRTATRGARDILMEAGWRSVPLLLDVLDDERATLDARTRAFDLVTSISGAEASGLGPSISSVSPDQIEKWREWRSMLEMDVR
jgi:hypothetical protein